MLEDMMMPARDGVLDIDPIMRRPDSLALDRPCAVTGRPARLRTEVNGSGELDGLGKSSFLTPFHLRNHSRDAVLSLRIQYKQPAIQFGNAQPVCIALSPLRLLKVV
jgi:hypothetical protein